MASGAALSGPYQVTVTVSDGTYSTDVSFAWTLSHAVAPAALEELEVIERGR